MGNKTNNYAIKDSDTLSEKCRWISIGLVIVAFFMFAFVVIWAEGSDCPTPTPAPSEQVWARHNADKWAYLIQDATGEYHGVVCDASGQREIASSTEEIAVKVGLCFFCLENGIGDFDIQPQCWASEGVK